MSFTFSQHKEFLVRRTAELFGVANSDHLPNMVMKTKDGFSVTFTPRSLKNETHIQFSFDAEHLDLDAFFDWSDSQSKNHAVVSGYLKPLALVLNQSQADGLGAKVALAGLHSGLSEIRHPWYQIQVVSDKEAEVFAAMWPTIWQPLFEKLRVACVELEKEFHSHPLMQYTAPPVNLAP